MKLEKFLSTKYGKLYSRAEWARQVGVTRGYFSQLAQGDKTPSLETALRIERVTEKHVTVYDWIDLDEEDGKSGFAKGGGLRGASTQPVKTATAE